MALQPNDAQIFRVLLDSDKPLALLEIAKATSSSTITVNKALQSLGRKNYARMTDGLNNLWEATKEGREAEAGSSEPETPDQVADQPVPTPSVSSFKYNCICGYGTDSVGKFSAHFVHKDPESHKSTRPWPKENRSKKIKPPKPLLSNRELKILTEVAAGRSNKQVATILSRSTQTVANHLKNIFKKLGVTDRTAAVVAAMHNGWIENTEKATLPAVTSKPKNTGNAGAPAAISKPPKIVEEENSMAAKDPVKTTEIKESKPPASENGVEGAGETIIPSQSDIFKNYGEQLGIGSRKDGVKLDAIVNYVKAMADLDSPTSIWNALTDMGLPADVKKRWIRMYAAQALPKQALPPDLRDKMSESDKDKVNAGEESTPAGGSPKPKRFTVVNDEILGDPDGDYNFKEALQIVAQNKGAGNQSGGIADYIAAMNVGPTMATTLIGALVPLWQKGSDDGKDGHTDLMATLITAIQASATAQVTAMQEQIKLLMTQNHENQAANKPSDQTVVLMGTMNQTIQELREKVHSVQLEAIQAQGKMQLDMLTGQLASLQAQLSGMAGGKAAESKLGFLENIANRIGGELTGVRADLKTLIPDIITRVTPRQFPADTKKAVSTELGKTMTATKQADLIGRDLWPKN